MLARARSFVAEGGVVYVEVPDGEARGRDGPGREEFFVEHLHVFSAASLALLADRAGFCAARCRAHPRAQHEVHVGGLSKVSRVDYAEVNSRAI